MTVLRLLPTLVADGPEQMASDEALLEAAHGPTLRLYTWAPPCVSLGYFQDHRLVAAGLAVVGPVPPLVRRITGGGAIWHEHEVTYALVGRLAQDGLPASPAGCYALIHRSVALALGRRGISPARQAGTVGDRRYRAEPRCFASPAAEDLMAQQGKLLGSAARVRADRILIHGSLKLASNPWDGATVATCGLDQDGASAALIEGIQTALGLPIRDGAWSELELAARTRIRIQRYASPDWVTRRLGPRP